MVTERTDTSMHAKPNVNVTPLIDILLVLLIIFMVITPLRPARFKALVPQPPVDRPEIHQSPRTLVVEIDEHLRLTLIRGKDLVAEGTVEDASAVAARLAAEWRERKLKSDWKEEMLARTDLAPDERIERTVFVRAPRSLRYGEIAKVVDSIKGAGAQPVGLQTDELPN
jgi:biopolymer transport protein ExbD